MAETLDIIEIDLRDFEITEPRNTPSPIPLRYVSQKPVRQLITIMLYNRDWDNQYHDFLLPMPWIIYEWAYVPHINSERPWLMNSMYFSPVPLTTSLHVSTPCLPNFYHTFPCCSDSIRYCQEDFADPSFIIDFWSEMFNMDGDLLSLGKEPHPVWADMAEKVGCSEYLSASEIYKVFSYWERLSITNLISLNWPQDLQIPERSTRL